MTLQEIKDTDKAMLTPADVAPVLNCDPHGIRVMARDCPWRLGFPVVRVGNRTKIPRAAFLEYIGEKQGKE